MDFLPTTLVKTSGARSCCNSTRIRDVSVFRAYFLGDIGDSSVGLFLAHGITAHPR